MFCHSEEIARQLNDSNAKIIFSKVSMSKIINEAVAITKCPIKIVYAKTTASDLLPAGGIDFNELTNTKGIDLTTMKSGGHPEDIALLPYSR